MPKILLNELPANVVDRLKKRQLGSGEAVLFPPRGSRGNFIWIGVGSVWLIALFLVLVDSFRWSMPKIVSLGIVTFFVLFLAFRSAFTLVRRRKRLFSQVLVTSNYVIEIDQDTVEYLPINQMIAADYRHLYQNRKYNGSNVLLTFEDCVKTIRLKDLNLAEDSVDRIGHFKKLFVEALERGDGNYIAAGDDFKEVSVEANAETTIMRRTSQHAFPMIIALLIGAGNMFAAVSLNEYFDDKRSWEIAVAGNRASGYRQYIQTHPEGRWLTESRSRLIAFYDEAEAKYLSSIGDGHDKQAVEAVSALLRYARETHQYRVLVSFQRKADVPADIVEKVKEDFEVKKVLPIGDTFTEEKMIGRENGLFAILTEAFGLVFSGDVLELTTECTNNCASFLVDYETSFLESIYYDVKEKELPREERTWSPGILINWKFTLRVPSESRKYEFELDSAPADEIDYDTPTDFVITPDTTKAILELQQASFYDAMVSSAFADFNEHLLFNFGVGPKPRYRVEGAETTAGSSNGE